MADLSDVESALVALIAQALYPQGTAAPPINGVPTAVYAGWPNSQDLDADLKALDRGHPSGILHVTVYPTATERNTTRFLRQWRQSVAPAPTLTVALAGQSATIGGTVSAPQNVALLANGKPYVYAVQASNTLAGIATALAALVSADVAGTTSAGPVVTVPAGARLSAGRIGAPGTALLELGRQERVFQITIWANSPANRALVGATIDPILRDTVRVAMPDGTWATMLYHGTREDDMPQKAALFRRDLLYAVEYATTVSETGMQITQTQLNQDADVAQTGITQPVATLYI